MVRSGESISVSHGGLDDFFGRGHASEDFAHAVLTQGAHAQLAGAHGGQLLLGPDLHADGDTRRVTVLTDDERPVVFYGEHADTRPATPSRREEP